jgi:hypothetical protein
MPNKLLAIAALAAFCSAAGAETVDLRNASSRRLSKVNAEPVTYKGRQALKVTDAATGEAEDRLVVFAGTQLKNGAIEVELAGEPAAGAGGGARGFVGIAFHVAPDLSKFEAFYLRPTNGRAEDQVRRNHSAQYISYPDYPWHRLRKETPEKYESYVDLVPGEWTRVRIEVKDQSARLYVHGATQPTLIVNDLKHGAAGGAVALWIGPGTLAHFADLKVTSVGQ